MSGYPSTISLDRGDGKLNRSLKVETGLSYRSTLLEHAHTKQYSTQPPKGVMWRNEAMRLWEPWMYKLGEARKAFDQMTSQALTRPDSSQGRMQGWMNGQFQNRVCGRMQRF